MMNNTQQQSSARLLKPFAWIIFAFSLLLNVTGLASIADGVVTWRSFLADWVSQYRYWVQAPLVALFDGLAPQSWPRPDKAFVDWLIICGSFWIAVDIFSRIFEKRPLYTLVFDNIVMDLREHWHKDPLWLTIIGAVLYLALTLLALVVGFLIGPLLYPLGVLFAEERPPPGTFRVFAIIYFYWGSILAFLIVLLFINWQFSRIS